MSQFRRLLEKFSANIQKEKIAEAALTPPPPVEICVHNEAIFCPIAGYAQALSSIPDKVFASGMMGEGLAIHPKDGSIYAPFDGKIVFVSPCGNSFGFTSNHGAEVIIHIGFRTMELNGRYFMPKKVQNERIRQGQLVAEFDLFGLEDAGYDPYVVVVVPNHRFYKRLFIANHGIVEVGDQIIYTNT